MKQNDKRNPTRDNKKLQIVAKLPLVINQNVDESSLVLDDGADRNFKRRRAAWDDISASLVTWSVK